MAHAGRMAFGGLDVPNHVEQIVLGVPQHDLDHGLQLVGRILLRALDLRGMAARNTQLFSQ